MKLGVESQAEKIVHKIKHYLITTMGRSNEQASIEEYYRAFSFALREEVMINWAATRRTWKNQDVRTLYYLSMEYLPGRLIGHNITSLHAQELVRKVSQRMGRSLEGVFACESDLGLGNGGLGRLASCFLDSLATQQYPAKGYGLRYQYGTFEQEIWNGFQVEKPDCWLLNENPWEFRRDQRASSVKFCGRMIQGENSHGDPVYDLEDYEEVRALAYDIPIIGYRSDRDFSVNTLRLWSTKESPRNFEMQRFNAGHLGPAAENTTLTDVLYPNDHHDAGKRIRLKQEFLLVSASLSDMIRHHLKYHEDLSLFPDKVRIQINDTHPALAIAELMRFLTKDYDMSWSKSWEVVATCFSYTNHTILGEALESWNQNRIRHLLPRQYDIIERLNLLLCNSVRAKFPGDEGKVQRVSIIQDGQVRMANLAIYGSHHVNGVAKLHSKILKTETFKDFYDVFPERFLNVTNGVTQRRWLLHCNPGLANFITQRIGDRWTSDFSLIRHLENFSRDEQSQQQLLEIKEKNKQRLIDYLSKEYRLRDEQGSTIDGQVSFEKTALFDVQIKRIHEYKRQLLNALHLIMLYFDLLEDPRSRKISRVAVIAGKAAAGYEKAKNIIRLIYCIARRVNSDTSIADKLKVVFVENYNVSKAELIIPAADLSQQISTAGLEASGTGNMKLAMNGALTVGTDDGANIEMRQEVGESWWPFSFGLSAGEIGKIQTGERDYDPWTAYAESMKISRALESLRDGTFSEDELENRIFHQIYYDLLEGGGERPDRYFVLADLMSYYEVQRKAEELFQEKSLWAEYVLNNIAGMGVFSSDASIERYAEKIWDLKACPVEKEALDLVRQEFAEHDQCRI